MAFRKFGTSDEQQVLSDDQDTQGVRKEAVKADRETIMRELAEENWETEGGNGSVHQ